MQRGLRPANALIRRRPVQMQHSSSTSSSASDAQKNDSDSRIADPGDSQILKLESGRTLGYATYGPETGRPLLWFHGFPTSRLEGSALLDAAKKRHLRVIAIDRPGFGLSSFQPQRCIMDWPADVAAVTSHLGLKRYSIIGNSGGGPFALACAYALPKDQLAHVGLFASAGPWAAGSHDMPRESRILGWAANRYPRVLKGFLTAVLGVARWLLHTRFVTRWLDQVMEKNVKESESKQGAQGARKEGRTSSDPPLTIAERRQKMLRILLDAFAQGTAGLVQEAQLLSSLDWGFRFEDVTYSKIQIWHGAKDTRSPVRQIRYMAERLPYVKLIEFKESGHFGMFESIEDALDQMFAEDDGKAK